MDTLLLPALALERLRSPLYDQLYVALRGAILEGRLKAGGRLPSTRSLAKELGVSRNTVLEAFSQLRVEGYIESRTGSGTYVTPTLPDHLLSARANGRPQPCEERPVQLSRRSQLILSEPPVPETSWRRSTNPFYPGLPAYELLPMAAWRRLADAHLKRKPTSELYGYDSAAGYLPLRTAIAEYLAAVRGVNCDPDQVIIVSGSQQGLDLTARVLIDAGNAVWIEDPGYRGARSAFIAADARVVPVPVDAEGLNIAEGLRRNPNARLAYVTPSHQYPLGYTMSAARRLEILDWAASADAWIVEDDYDSEFRYSGRPLPALQGLDEQGRVIYVGSFSKVLFPALRIGYLVVPKRLISIFVAAHALTDRHHPTLEQAVLADFVSQDHFARHLRRVRVVYQERQRILVEGVRENLADLLDVAPDAAGMHLVGWLPEGVSDAAVADRCAEVGISAPPLSYYSFEQRGSGALILGYTGFGRLQIKYAVERLARVLRSLVEG